MATTRRQYYSGRSPLEAASLGIPLVETDVTYRCNLVTLSGEARLEDTTMVDYSAGEISTEEAGELIRYLDRANFPAKAFGCIRGFPIGIASC